MKVLIWFLCILAYSIITTLIKECGIILGGIPTVILFGGTMWLARTLCTKWDEHKETKTEQKEIAQTINSSTGESKLEAEDRTKFCKNCGAKLIDNSLFCRKCGIRNTPPNASNIPLASPIISKDESPKNEPPKSSPVSQPKIASSSSTIEAKPAPPSVATESTDIIGNYAIIQTKLASGFTENARNIIKQQIKKITTEHKLTRKIDMMKLVFGYISQELVNAKGPQADLVVCAYYQIAFDEIVSRCGDMNDFIFECAALKVTGANDNNPHKYMQMLIRIQSIIDDAMLSCKNSAVFQGYSTQLRTQVFNELNAYIDDTTDWNKL